jgi:glycosyltransferase involved in cell wall biosynthesis
VPGLRLIETGLPLDWTAEDADQLRATAAALAELAAKADAALVQLHAPSLAVACYRAPVITVVHSCVATWWAAVKQGPLPHDFTWRTALTHEGLERSDLVVAPSRAFAEAVQAGYRLQQPPAVVHNGRTAGQASERDGPCFAFTASRLWDEGKNLATFDAAAALSSTPFRAAGPLHGPNGATAHLRHAEPLGLLDEDTLAQTFAEQPVFVSAARYEPFGLAVLEAAQAGCPLVLSSLPTFRELWQDAAVFADTPEAIAAAVDHFASHPAERSRHGAAARLRSKRFTTQATARSMLDHYRAFLPAEQRVAA